MTEQNSDHRVRIVSQGYNSWRVQVLFQDTSLSATEISDRLREVKAELASHVAVPDSLLEYKQLHSKKITRQGLLVQMQIIKQDVPSGAPQFRALPMTLDDGTLFSDMRIEATLYPYDEFDRPLTREVVEARLKRESFDLECIEWPVVLGALEDMQRTLHPIKDLEVGRGDPPSLGQCSRLTYGVPSDQDQFLASAWMGVRPVRRGEFLVEVSSATAGHTWGRNVYRRELEPRQGLCTRLVAGSGTKLVARDTQIVALHEGLIVFERAGHDRRDRDTCDLIPVKLTASVLPITTMEQSQVFDLTLTEPTAILATVEPGSNICSSQPLFIRGDVGEGTKIRCSSSLRIAGNVRKAEISCGRHVYVSGEVSDSTLKAELTVQADGRVADSSLWGTDVFVNEISGGHVEALRQTSISHTRDTGGRAAAIRINLHEYLENRQLAGQEVLVELRESLRQILNLFGPEITLQVKHGSAQRMLLKWLQQQKAAGAPNYTRAEVQEFRTVLEMIPLIQEQAKAIGMELRDITSQLTQSTPEDKTEN